MRGFSLYYYYFVTNTLDFIILSIYGNKFPFLLLIVRSCIVVLIAIDVAQYTYLRGTSMWTRAKNEVIVSANYI